MQDLNPFKWREQWTLVKNFTPEETETLDTCLQELKANCKYYCSISVTATLAFNYWQRAFVPRKFYFFSLGTAMVAGTIFGGVRTSWFFVEQMDRLGSNYELSRMMKQDIFDTRPDMNAAMRAQYYEHQQRVNEER